MHWGWWITFGLLAAAIVAWGVYAWRHNPWNERDPMSKKVKVDPVAEYIYRNLVSLKADYPDGIWE
jgi:hypothetical protein